MTPIDDRSTFEGKPPKSPSLIRSLLKSIHEANDPRPSGPYTKGLPKAELNAMQLLRYSANPIAAQPIIHEPKNYCHVLVNRATIVGGFTGGLLGVNIGFLISIVFTVVASIPISILIGLFVGAACGVMVAQDHVVRLRPDLFQAALLRPRGRSVV